MTDAIREAVERCEAYLDALNNQSGVDKERIHTMNDTELRASDIRALLSLVRGVMPRPIEEAPKDGELFLAFYPPDEESDDTAFWEVIRWRTDADGMMIGGREPTDFVFLDALPLPQEEPHG